MQLSFELDGVEAVTKRLDDMRTNIEKHGEIFAELGRWERADMNRRHTYAKHRRTGAAVIVRQHSWWETKGRRKAARRLIHKGKFVPRWSTRPPLRPELWDRMVERMVELAQTKLRWGRS